MDPATTRRLVELSDRAWSLSHAITEAARREDALRVKRLTRELRAVCYELTPLLVQWGEEQPTPWVKGARGDDLD